MKPIDLEDTLRRLEQKEQFKGERLEFYRMIDEIWENGQVEEQRMYELIGRYKRFGRFMRG